MSEKRNQFHFHCLVRYKIHLFPFIFFPSSHFLSDPLLYLYFFKPNIPSELLVLNFENGLAGFTGIDDPYEPPLNCEVGVRVWYRFELAETWVHI